MSSVKKKLDSLKDALSSKIPFCSGTLGPIPKAAFSLFFKGADETAGWIDLSSPTQPKLSQLSDACQPAPFGRGQENVQDETYRKAGKLDTTDFATGFDLDRSGLVDVIEEELLEELYKFGLMEVEAELYKLNVYGEKSFFKPHKDTPRSQNMFGSLIVVFPTPHEGGALILRHGGKEWTFESSKTLSESASASATTSEPQEQQDQSSESSSTSASESQQQQNPEGASIAYIAFFSDVEHEVTEVTLGYRVTLTYNLYHKLKPRLLAASQTETDTNTMSVDPPSHKAEFKNTLSQLLQDPEFLPVGGRLGFGLHHQYPVNSKTGSLEKLLSLLKGSDAIVKSVCQDLGLKVSLKAIYTDEDHSGEEELIMVSNVVDMSGYFDLRDGISSALCDDFGGQVVTNGGSGEGYEIWWVTPVNKLTRAETPYVAYGNEATLAYMYGDICLIVDVGPNGPGMRGTVPKMGSRQKRAREE